jgi:tetratricopeptide (TPR) repeat protein
MPKTIIMMILGVLFIENISHANGSENLTIKDRNYNMFLKTMEAQHLSAMGKNGEAIIKYREAIKLAKNKDKDEIEFESYIHCKQNIAGLLMGGKIIGKMDNYKTQDQQMLWDEAIIEYQNILNEIKGKEGNFNKRGIPYIYEIKKGS